MILLGLILIVAAVGVGGLVAVSANRETTPVQMDVLGLSVGMKPIGLLIVGAAVMLLLWLGLVMIRSSLHRKARHRREAKELEREESLRREEESRESERLRAENERNRVEADRARESEAAAAEERRRTETRDLQARHRADAAGVPAADTGTHRMTAAESDDLRGTTHRSDVAEDRNADPAAGSDLPPEHEPKRTVADKLMGRPASGPDTTRE